MRVAATSSSSSSDTTTSPVVLSRGGAAAFNAGVMANQTSEPIEAALPRLRAERGLTQEQLARRTPFTVGTVRLIERGVTQAPKPGTLEALAKALDVDPSYFPEYRLAQFNLREVGRDQALENLRVLERPARRPRGKKTGEDLRKKEL